MKASQCDGILAVLADGRPHRMEEIHQRVGFCRLNSRVAELRKRGHHIECDKTGGRYIYRLLLRETDVSQTEAPASVSLSSIGTTSITSPPGGSTAKHDERHGAAQQLQLVVA